MSNQYKVRIPPANRVNYSGKYKEHASREWFYVNAVIVPARDEHNPHQGTIGYQCIYNPSALFDKDELQFTHDEGVTWVSIDEWVKLYNAANRNR